MIFRLLALPVTGPLWAARQVVAAAENQHYDERNVLRELAELDRRRRAGEIPEEDFRVAEQALADRLAIARQRKG